MPAIIKSELRIFNLDRFREAIVETPSYVFISQKSQWDDEGNPPIPVDSVKDEYRALSEIAGMKRILSTDMVSVMPRIDWHQGTVYDQYDDKVDLFNTKNPVTGAFWRFCVLTQDFNVYKCLNNNDRNPSNTSPSGTSTAPFQTPDGYVWKYMYNISPNDALKFMTTNWIPCYTAKRDDGTAFWNNQQAAIPGTLDNILVVDPGVGYSTSTPPDIQINGDGAGAEAVPDIDPITGEIRKINMLDYGSGYTHVEINIVDPSSNGSGAKVRPIISPRMGHGWDPRAELGANYLMIKSTIGGDEDGDFEIDISYRTSGIVVNPKSTDTAYMLFLNKDESKRFRQAETITGSVSSATADIVLIDYINDILYVDNMTGTLQVNEDISSTQYNQTTVTAIDATEKPLTEPTYSASDFDAITGKILFVANREKIDRVAEQKEDIIEIITF